MTTYTLLIYQTLAAGVREPALEEPRVYSGHRKLQKEAGAKGDLHAVARLDEPATARMVRLAASGHEVTDGPFIEAKEWLVGFYLVDCMTEAEAIERAKQICPGPHHVIEVRPVTWRWTP